MQNYHGNQSDGCMGDANKTRRDAVEAVMQNPLFADTFEESYDAFAGLMAEVDRVCAEVEDMYNYTTATALRSPQRTFAG